MRIIDGDALHEEISKWPESVMYKDWVQSAIANAPTIVPPPNDPLTLEELREMDGEPVWIRYINSETDKYHIVRAFGKNSIVFEEYDKEFGPYKSLFLGNYGKIWLAYRRKPEGGV